MSVVMCSISLLKESILLVDTVGMVDTELHFDALDNDSCRLLDAYVSRDSALRAADPEHDGWMERFDTLEDIEADALTRIHGRLIATGMIKFELTSRNVGLRYQISNKGRQALASSRQAGESEDSANSPDAESSAPEAA